MESHIFLGCWNCFFCRKNALRILTSLWGQHLAHAAPSQARAPLPPLRCAGVAGGSVGAFASGPPGLGLGGWWEELAESKALRISRKRPVKNAKGSLKHHFFLSWAVQLRGCTLPENEQNAPSWRLRKWCSSANGWNMKYQFPAVHFLGVRPPWN